MRTTATEHAQTTPAWLIVVVTVQAALAPSVASLLLAAILTLSRPTGGQIALMILAYAGLPLLLIALAAYAARAAWRRHRGSAAIAVAVVPLLLMAAAFGVAVMA